MQNQTIRQPPQIKHYPYRPRGYKEMVKHVSHIVGLGERAGKLQAVYADSAEGFRPSLKLVEDRTGIKTNKVSEIRQEIIKHGLMTYVGNKDVLLIHWGRIESFATFDHQIFEHGRYMPIRFYTPPKAIKDQRGYQKPTAAQGRVEAPWENAFFEWLEGMTEPEYQKQIYSLALRNKEVSDRIISKEDYFRMIDLNSKNFHFIPCQGVYNYLYTDPAFSKMNVTDVPTFETVEVF